jgi:putative transcriptional regulator
MSKAGKRLLAAASEAIAIARGDVKAARIYIPAHIDVKAIRAKVSLTQEDFASQFGFTVNQIRDWEQGRNRPLGGVRAYLMLIDRNPEMILRMLREEVREAA